MADIGQVLFCVFMHRDEVAVNKNAEKGFQYPAILTIKASLKKNFLFGQEEKFFSWAQGKNLERAIYAYLASLGSQSEHRILFILPARGFSHHSLQA